MQVWSMHIIAFPSASDIDQEELVHLITCAPVLFANLETAKVNARDELLGIVDCDDNFPSELTDTKEWKMVEGGAWVLQFSDEVSAILEPVTVNQD